MANTLSLTGTSGKSYVFEKYILNTTFKPVGALYLFTKEEGGKNYAIYLGQTKDLSSRFTNHHKETCIDGRGATHVSVCQIPEEAQRLTAEKDLLGTYNCPCNEINN